MFFFSSAMIDKSICVILNFYNELDLHPHSSNCQSDASAKNDVLSETMDNYCLSI